MKQGFDAEAVVTRDAAQCLANAGMQFAGRYYSSVDASKVLTAAEVTVLATNGLTIVTVYEDEGQPASYFTTDRGTRDATTAMSQATAAGQPQGSAIYFAVDYDAPAFDIASAITPYFTAVANVLDGTYKVGVYGSTAVCAALTAVGLVSYTWLTESTAWGWGVTFASPSIRQYVTTSPCLSIDGDTAPGDFGGW